MEHLALARWIELAEAEGVAAAVEAAIARGEKGLVEAVGSARLVYAGPESPVSQAYGLGFDGPVDEALVQRVIAFFDHYGCPVKIPVCPMADPSLIEVTRALGFRLQRLGDTLARPLQRSSEWAPRPEQGFTVRPIDPQDPAEVERLALLLARGFADGAEPPESEVALERMMIRNPTVLAVVAEQDGQALGGGLVGINQQRAALFAGSTLPEHRRRGVQLAVMRERLRLAAELGARVAVVSATPGVGTRRNAERLGFKLVYTRPTLLWTRPSEG